MTPAQRQALQTGYARRLDNIVQEINRMQKLAEFSSSFKAALTGLNARVDKMTPRLAALEKKGGLALDRIEAEVADYEAQVKQAEDMVNQLSNAPLGNSPKLSQD